jgi:hypothetical protein
MHPLRPLNGVHASAAPVLHDIAVSVVFGCPCTPSRVLVIRNIDHAVTCPSCQRQYHVAAAAFDPAGRPPLSEPTIVRPFPGA